MITFLDGTLDAKQPTSVVMNLNGVGYEVAIPLSSYDALPLPGESCRILIHHHIREDAETLFGFMSEDERELFRLLLSISGIGPKIALSALSGMSAHELRVAIVEGDVKRLNSISGVGKKTAERVIIELRDKISAAAGFEAVNQVKQDGNQRLRDATLALMGLGYRQLDAAKMVETVSKKAGSEELSVEALVKAALSG